MRTDRVHGRLGASGWGAVSFLALFALAAVAAPLLPLDAPSITDYHAIAAAPNGRHWLGTDQLGRDLLSRLIWGGRVSFTVGFGSMALGAALGSSLGLVAGFQRGWLGAVLMRLMDLMLAFPALVFALVVLTALGPSVLTVTMVLGVLFAPAYARIVYGQVVGLSQREFVLAGIGLGMSRMRLMFGEVLPNVRALIVNFGLSTLGIAVMVEGGLSFLGVSVAQPTPTWGSMIEAGRPVLMTAPFISLFPATVLSLVVLAANSLGAALVRQHDTRWAQV